MRSFVKRLGSFVCVQRIGRRTTVNHTGSPFVLLLLVLTAGFSPYSAAARSADPQDSSPIAPGTWEGYLERILTAENAASGVSVTARESFNGPIVLQVGSGGEFSGVVGPVDIDFVYSVSLGGGGGTCDGQSTFEIVGGSAATGAGGLPILTLDLQPTSTSFECTFDIGGATFTRNTLTLQATTDSGIKLTGDALEFDSEWLGPAVANMRQAGATVTVSEYWELVSTAPVVEVVTPELEFIFLEGISVQNTYEAIVNWNNNEPGRVVFTLAGDSRETPASDVLVSQPMDMGGAPAGTNVLEVVAYTADGVASEPHAVDVQIAGLEPWAKEAGFHLKGPTGGFPSGVIYAGTAHVPPEPIRLPFVDLSVIPLVGGRWGVPPVQLDVNLEATSLGGPSAETPVEGDLELDIGRDVYAIQIEGGAVTNMQPTSLLFDHGKATFNLDPVTFEERAGLTDLLPGIGRLDVPVIKDVVDVLESVASVRGQVTVSASGHGDLGVAGDRSKLDIVRGEITPRIGVYVIPGINLVGIAWANVSGGGQGAFTIQVAPNQKVTDCSVELTFRAGVGVIGGWERTFAPPPKVYNCGGSTWHRRVLAAHDPSWTAPHGASDDPLSIAPRPAGWRPERAVQVTAQANRADQVTLVEDASVHATPVLAMGPDDRLALVWMAEDPDKPRQQANEIRLRLSDGQNWNGPIDLTSDTRLDASPTVAFDSRSNVIVAWTRSKQEALDEDALLTGPFLTSLETAYAVVDAQTGEVLETGTLTDDQVMDVAPQLTRAEDGTVWLAWMHSPGPSLVGTADAPNAIQAARWDGRGWAEPETVTEDLVGTLSWRLAAGSKNGALVVADVDTDGDLATGEDREVVVVERDRGGWREPQRVTENQVLDMAPLVTFDSAGRPVLAWYSEGQWLGLSGDLLSEPAVWLDTAEGTAFPAPIDGTLLAGADGQLGIVWPGDSPTGPDVWLATYDPASKRWGAPVTLFDSDLLETGLTAAVARDGDLVLTMARAEVETEEITLSDGETFALPLQPQAVDLVVSRSEGVFAPQQAATIPWLPLGGSALCLCLGGAVALAAGVGGVVLWRARKRRQYRQSAT